MRRVRPGVQCHVSTVSVELPDEPRVSGKSLGRGEDGGVVVAPEAAFAAEGWEAGGG